MKALRSLAVLAAIVLIAGCAGSPPALDAAHAVAGALANYERLASLKTEEQRREFNAARAAHERTPNDTTRLDLALAMLLPRAPWRDDARVQSLLGGIEATADQPHSARHDLAQLLLGLLSERQRAQRDEQRKADQLMIQLREERRKTEEMQQKIESLRAIDREMGMQRKAP
jgi:outer membrane PBP1 activator LpoA protein